MAVMQARRFEPDPCPGCGVKPTEMNTEHEYGVSNPEAVFPAMGNLPAMPNPSPNPALDEYFLIDTSVTFQPCGHTFSGIDLSERGWRYQVIG